MRKRRVVRVVAAAAVVILSALALTVCGAPYGLQYDQNGVTEPLDTSGDEAALIRITVLFGPGASEGEIQSLGRFGRIAYRFNTIRAAVIEARASDIEAIRSLSFVVAANRDAVRTAGPLLAIPMDDFASGDVAWDLDAIDVGNASTGREVFFTGEGVYVAVLDTGLLRGWTRYFPPARIASEFATSFAGIGNAAWEQPYRWNRDTNSHGTHVVSTIIGYNFDDPPILVGPYDGTPVNGVAPLVKIIPVKVLNQAGIGWSSAIARGIEYIGDLKAGPLAGSPVVINMSLGGGQLDAAEQAAIDYAISQGVIIVASAGNEGEQGMGYPGAYAPVISVASSGWTGEWVAAGWPLSADVPDPTNPKDFYITDSSSRKLAGQDLDVAAPGSWILGPYQERVGLPSYYYLGGTSMASPHVAGIVALMAQKQPGLLPAQAESILEKTAIHLPAGSRLIHDPLTGSDVTVTWGDDATGNGLANTAAAIAATPPPQQ